jgi:pyridoxamine 5'-phosphate oxidase
MFDNNSIAAIRKVYKLQSLLEKDVDPNPVLQFEKWWQQAIESKIDEVNAMTLSTSTSSGIPSSRIVLLKGIQQMGFTFFTNYDSRKGKEIEENSQVALLFFWKEMERQVRIEGIAKKISGKESDEYFNSRPRESRIGAWSSPQSTVIINRNVLEENEQKYEKEFDKKEVPRPPNWGGYNVQPQLMEFWQGRPGRLHDRIQYTKHQKNHWLIDRLAP